MGNTKLDYTLTSGVELKATPRKITTVLGIYKDDTGKILEELGNVKSMDLEPRDGGFNLLNTPDKIYNQIGPEAFWEQYNKSWLDNTIERGDIITSCAS